MIAFALAAWRFPGETGKGHVFRGMFSLPQQDEAFLVTREHAGNKSNENHVPVPGAPRVWRRPPRSVSWREVLEMGIDDVDWRVGAKYNVTKPPLV